MYKAEFDVHLIRRANHKITYFHVSSFLLTIIVRRITPYLSYRILDIYGRPCKARLLRLETELLRLGTSCIILESRLVTKPLRLPSQTAFPRRHPHADLAAIEK